jgi:cysteine desulfurase/selenocysteine lyase
VTDSPYAAAFGPFDGRIWLNAAHQGPLPLAAAAALQSAIADRMAPYSLADTDFTEIPARLRGLLARLVGGEPEEIALGNSASYGLDVLARGIPWRAGDEVLVVDGDFPASVFPWRVLEPQGVAVRFMRAAQGLAPDADEVSAHLGDRTRVFCASWVNSFTGRAIDLEGIGRACRARGVWFVVNGSQGIGVRALDVRRTTVDAITTCGYKFLCGPYGTGFLWVSPALRDILAPLHTYWLPSVWNQPGGLQQYDVRVHRTAVVHDIGCPANFFNYRPWIAALDYLLGVGVPTIAEYVQSLADDFVRTIDENRYELLSGRSPLIALRPRIRPAREIKAQLAAHGIDVAQREDAIRLAPHLYNSRSDLARAAHVLVGE